MQDVYDARAWELIYDYYEEVLKPLETKAEIQLEDELSLHILGEVSIPQ